MWPWQRLRRVDRHVDLIMLRLEMLMKADQQVLEALAKLNETTNQMAAAEEAQTAVLIEIAADIDTLLAGGSDTGLSDDTQAQLASFSDRLKAVAEFETAQVDTLKSIAAKNDPVA
jgi:type IV pilus biogenesis protein CpaD/CtpE